MISSWAEHCASGYDDDQKARSIVFRCDACNEPIRDGYDYYAVGDEKYCENCCKRKEAEL